MNATQDNELRLPGYTLSKRLGAGGYGEVWQAIAPGGLTKAVKFIFGSFQERRAEHELRALQRIKEVRHPFLLSLERIDVVDGRLVIVTELAEASLKDRFDECRRNGLPGVPRDELLKYLRDAADALDFISTKHSLQHLDVKPENLLVIAGHIKVADFGLVKDIGQTQASLVGGLTPLYSAPEVFQGTPTASCDQYSLAILFQEMLTGALPFAGQTAAELTMQHLHDEPDLSSLPLGDRYVLARALAKDAGQRFASCSDLIEALRTATDAGEANWNASPPPEQNAPARTFAGSQDAMPSRPGAVTEFFDEPVESQSREVSPSMLIDWSPPHDSPLRIVPGPDPEGAAFRPRPALVIGIGGCAAPILQQLRARLVKQYGPDGVPAVQLLLLDPDPKAISKATGGNQLGALKPEETLSLPLRRPQDYRDQSSRLMRWLSRRWLYNIPRSLRTEGLRPLGRLAFADHARQIVQRIRLALSTALTRESLALSAERTGLDFDATSVRVYVVASISGGAGSGMSLDVGYAVRAALEKMELPAGKITGVFLRSAGADPRRCDLAKVNAFAWLTEFNHFHRPGVRFPGDESCGLPATDAPAFDHAYFIDLGQSLDDEQLNDAAASVAHYIQLDSLTHAQRFLDGCRYENGGEANRGRGLRTFCLQTTSARSDERCSGLAAEINRRVLLSWLGGPLGAGAGIPSLTGLAAAAADSEAGQDESVAQFIEESGLQLDQFAAASRRAIEAQFGGDLGAFVAKVIGHGLPQGGDMPAKTMLRVIEGLFAPADATGDQLVVLGRPIEQIVGPVTTTLSKSVRRWALGRLDDPAARIAGARSAVRALAKHLEHVAADAHRMTAAMVRQAEQCTVNEPVACEHADLGELAMSRLRMCVDLQAVRSAAAMAERLMAVLESLDEMLVGFKRQVIQLAHQLAPETWSPSPGQLDGSCAMTPIDAAVESIERHVQETLIHSHGGLFQAMMVDGAVRSQILAEVANQSARAAERLAGSWDQSCGDRATAVADNASAESEQRLVAATRHGGTFRRLVVAGDACAASALAATVGEPLDVPPTELVCTGAEPIVCYEGGELPLEQIAIDLIERRRDYADFAARVFTRTDVAWTPLTAAPTFEVNQSDKHAATTAPRMTQVL